MNIILFKEGEERLPLSDSRATHILKILKLKEGDKFLAGYINGKKGEAKIEKITKDEIIFSFNFTLFSPSVLPLTLIIAQVRPICMKRILRESVSMGVKKLVLTVSDLGEKSYLSSSLYTTDEYKKIMLDGAMQSGETNLPECFITKSIEDAVKYSEGKRFFLDNVIGKEELANLKLENESVTLSIGPERGWSDRERTYFLEKGFSPCLLGKRILRTETAVVASTFLTLSKMGNLV